MKTMRLSIKKDQWALYILSIGFIFALIFALNWMHPVIEISWVAYPSPQVFGYNVHRWDNESRQYVQINPAFITEIPDPLEPSIYSFIDKSPPQGTVHRYKVAEIYLNGSSKMSEPIEISLWFQGRNYLLVSLIATSMGFSMLCVPRLIKMRSDFPGNNVLPERRIEL
jgi:hypothetical protein